MRAFVVFLAHVPALLAFIISILSFIYIFIQKAVTETFDENIPTSPNAEAVFELIKNIRSEIMNKETEMVSLLRSEIKNKDTEMESLLRTIPDKDVDVWNSIIPTNTNSVDRFWVPFGDYHDSQVRNRHCKFVGVSPRAVGTRCARS